MEGIALRYGEISPTHRERFAPGAFDLSGGPTRWLDYRHDRTRVLAHTEGGGLSLRDTEEALILSADLPRLPLADRALEEIRSGSLSGLSIEFHVREESRDGEIRVVEKADLAGIGLVESPSYPASRIETRQAGVVSTLIPYGKNLACECCGRKAPRTQVQTVEFLPDSLVIPEEGLDAIWKSFAAPLASIRKGTLRIDDDELGLRVEIDLPDTTWGRDIAALSDASPIYVRPMFDPDEIESSYKAGYEGADRILQLRKVPVRALLVGGTPNSKGWPEAEITPNPEGRRSQRERRYAWL